MEQNKPDSLFDLQVDHESRNHFKETTKWSNFISVIFFICFGLLVLVLLLAGPTMLSSDTFAGRYEGAPQIDTGDPTLKIVRLVLVTIFLVYAGVMLLRFSSACKKGVEMQDQQSFNFGLRGLRNFFVALGIFTVLSLVGDIITVINTF